MKKTRENRVILIHGMEATNQDHWFPWLEKKLTEAGTTVVNKTFPDANKARSKFWLPYLQNEIKAGENDVIVGHSSGAVAALRYAESNPLTGIVLLGVNYTDLGDPAEQESGYFADKWNWEKIKQNLNWSIVLASVDDPYIPVVEPWFMKDQLKAEYHEYTDQMHFGSPHYSPKEFPELYWIIKRKVKGNS